MSGRKQFEEEAAIDAAMRAFWRNGFDATSIADLEAATGLSKSSLYNAFGSKDAMFVRCLERFGAIHGLSLVARLDGPEFVPALRSFFDGLVERLANPDVPDGCLATMAAMEVGNDGSASARLVRANLDAMHAAFESRCRQAVSDGELSDNVDCRQLASLILSTTRGIAVLNRGHPDPVLVGGAVDALLGLIASAAGPARPSRDWPLKRSSRSRRRGRGI